MIKHHTKTKGDIGVLKVSADLAIKGYLILNPLTEHAPFDIVVYDGEKFLRIQIKYRRKMSNGSLDLDLGSGWRYKLKDGKRQVDIAAVYCPDNDTCYYVSAKLFSKVRYLRIDKTANNQERKVNYANKYLNVPVAELD